MGEAAPTGRQADLAGPAKQPSVARRRLADQAYAHLLHRIVTGDYAEGAALPSENELSRLFAVSRPVVREALDRLRAGGLIEPRQGLGTFVRPRLTGAADPAAIAEQRRLFLSNLEFRDAIEPRAAALAAERRTAAELDAIASALARYERVAVAEGSVGEHLDFAFHLTVAEASGNARFVEAIRTVAFDIDHGVNVLRFLARFHHLDRSRSVLADHLRVFDAIGRREPAAAEAAMREHLDHARVRMIHSRPPVDAGIAS